ncbi:hypothetical protein GGG16DRAFT_12755, partial [Schizophyllum commune]
CEGVEVVWTPGQPCRTYAWASHEWAKLKWQPIGFEGEDRSRLRLRALGCTRVLAGQDRLKRTCRVCEKVPNSKAFMDMLERAVNAPPHTPYPYLNHDQISERLRATVRHLKKRLAASQAQLEDYTRLLKFIADHEIAAVHRLIAVALDNGASPSAMVELLQKSIDHLYRPTSRFTQRDYDKAFLAKALGGPRLLHALMKADGYPSLTSLNRRHRLPELAASIGTPTKDEMTTNLSNVLDPTLTPPPARLLSGEMVGIIVMIDGVALDEVCRYCKKRNALLGLCREHGHRCNPRDTSLANLNAIEQALKPSDKRTVPLAHWGKDGTVLAIASLTDRDNYTPIPLLLSPSCKAETGKELAKWLKLFLEVWHSHPYGEALWGPVRCVASDGESSFRNARYLLAMGEELSPESDHGKILRKLRGFNCQTGPSLLLGTCDFKHVIKRGASWLRSNSNIFVHRTLVTPSHTLAQLKTLEGMTADRAKDLMDPADKMNVPKAVWLFEELGRLRTEAPDLIFPFDQAHRNVISFCATMFNFFICPFTTTTMGLRQQVRSLATYSHLSGAMYTRHGTEFMGAALLADSQSIVKAIFFNIITLQLLDRLIRYYLVLDGTDRIERLFSNVRTQDHSRNFDTLQLSEKLSISAAITAILIRNPDLDRGHRRRNLKGAVGVDKVNPASWEGDVTVGSVDVQREWEEGAREANRVLEEYFGSGQAFDFATHFDVPGRDFLRPTGEYAAFSGADSEDFIDEESDALSRPSADEEALPHANEVLGGHFDDEPDINVEETLERAVGSDVEVEQPSPTHLLEINGQSIRKDAFLPRTLSAKNPHKTIVRTLRAAGIRDEWIIRGKGGGEEAVVEHDEDEGAGLVKQGDPLACLVRCRSSVALAVIAVVAFEQPLSGGKSARLTRIPADELDAQGKSVVRVTGQVAQLVQATANNVISSSRSLSSQKWIWTGDYLEIGVSASGGRFSRVSQRQYTVVIPGFACWPLGAKIVRRANPANRVDGLKPLHTWLLDGRDLEQILQSAWRAITFDARDAIANIGLLPNFKDIDALPYTDNDGSPCMHLKDVPAQYGLEKLEPSTRVPCQLCNKLEQVKDMRNHVGKHILRANHGIEDDSLPADCTVGAEPCGWCGRDDRGCIVHLLIPKGKGARQTISNCRYHYATMPYASASKSTKTNPVTNVPIHCPLCEPSDSGQPRTIWKYNAARHISIEHGDTSDGSCMLPADFIIDIFITSAEERAIGIPAANTKVWREGNRMPDSDDV